MFTDTGTGLNLTLYRAYSPEQNRWLSRDPMGEAVGPNLYSYVNENPVSYIDPLGLCDEDRCRQLLEKMDTLVNSVRPGDNPSIYKGLAQRFRQILRTPPREFPGHVEQIEQRQAQLQKVIQDYIDSGCGDPPAFAKQYVNMPIPAPPSPNGNNFIVDPQTQRQLVQGTAEAGVLATVLRILAGAVLAF